MPDESPEDRLDAIFGRHMDAEVDGDLDATLATTAADPHLVNVPTMVGGSGPDGVRTFYSRRLIGQFFPPDVEFETISRTHSAERLVDERRIGGRAAQPVAAGPLLRRGLT
jgi:carboxymethylenebutenolidase